MTPVVAGLAQVRAAGRSPVGAHALGVRAIRAALDDAGLGIEDVDGVVRFDREAAWEYDLPGVLRMPRLDWYVAVPFGPGSAPALLGLATMAVAQGLARVVVGWHARDGGPAAGRRAPFAAPAAASSSEFAAPFGLARDEDVVAVAVRQWVEARGMAAALAVGTRSPGRATAGAGAFVVAAHERSGRRRGAGVRVLGWSQAALPSVTRQLPDWFDARRTRAMRAAARALWRQAGVRPADVDVACVPADPPALAALALDDWGVTSPACALARPARRRADGLHVNPHAGHPHAAGLDGMDDVLEAVRQLRGDAARPVRRARVAFAAGSPLEPTSAVVLAQDR